MAASIKPGILSPIIENLTERRCVNCKKLTARWYVDKRDLWCSYCYINETDWSRENHNDIIKMARQVEANLKIELVDSNNKILESEADRILSSIVFSSLYVAARDKIKNK